MFQIIAITRRKIRVSRIITCANELVLVLVHVNWVGVWMTKTSRDPQRDKLHAYLCNIWCARHYILQNTCTRNWSKSTHTRSNSLNRTTQLSFYVAPQSVQWIYYEKDTCFTLVFVKVVHEVCPHKYWHLQVVLAISYEKDTCFVQKQVSKN